jgi:hypothetical protein
MILVCQYVNERSFLFGNVVSFSSIKLSVSSIKNVGIKFYLMSLLYLVSCVSRLATIFCSIPLLCAPNRFSSLVLGVYLCFVCFFVWILNILSLDSYLDTAILILLSQYLILISCV